MKRTISISLLLIFLVGQSGFELVTHYCGGIAVETQIVVGHAELHCGMSNMETDCETGPSKRSSLKKKNCCENQYQSLDLETEFHPDFTFSSTNLEFISVFLINLAPRSYLFEDDKAKDLNYSPPPIKRDIPLLVQSFLI